MERVWLKATSMALSIQPTTAILFFMQRILGEEAQDFSQNHIALIRKAHHIIEEAFETKGKTVAMLFRIGKGEEPTARSPRFPVEKFIMNS